jgi:uncharacterized membrane protein HdeD (DUF308 family)
MNAETERCCPCEQLEKEFQHLRSDWWWMFLFGALLVVCGSAAVIFPAITVVSSFVAVAVLGTVMVVGGIATIIAAFWAGKWGGLLLELLVGILYTAVGFMIFDRPFQSLVTLTLFLAAFFIVVGGFRIVAALTVRFPYWGWSLLNGLVTFLLGVIIFRLYRHFPETAFWIPGLMIGIEMLLHGWTWMMLSLAVRRIPAKAA